MEKLLNLIDSLDDGSVGSGEDYLHDEIFDFVYGAMVPSLQQVSEVWLILSDDVKEQYGLKGNIKLNANNCKSCTYNYDTRVISVDISINGVPGIYQFAPGDYIAAYTDTDVGLVDVAQVVIQDFTAQITISYFNILGMETNVEYQEDSVITEPKLISSNSERVSKSSTANTLDKVKEVRDNVVFVDFGASDG